MYASDPYASSPYAGDAAVAPDIQIVAVATRTATPVSFPRASQQVLPMATPVSFPRAVPA